MTDPLLRTSLAEHDAACPACDYSLRGVESETCPECGEKLTVALLKRRRPLAAWLISLSALLLYGLVIGLSMVLAVTVEFYPGYTDPIDAGFFLVMAVALGCLLAGWALARWRRTFTRWPIWVQWTCAALVTSPVWLGLFFAIRGA